MSKLYFDASETGVKAGENNQNQLPHALNCLEIVCLENQPVSWRHQSQNRAVAQPTPSSSPPPPSPDIYYFSPNNHGNGKYNEFM